MVDKGSKFITTEPIAVAESGKDKVWEAVKSTFADRNCIGYWRYPIFSKVGDISKEPDILIADREFGLVVMEILSVTIDQIVEITEDIWHLEHVEIGNYPSLQAKHQLHAVIAHSDRQPALWRKVNGRAMVALPLITQEQWQQRGYNHDNAPTIIFQDQLSNTSLLERIGQTPPVVPGENLEDKDWELLLSVIAGTTVLAKPPRTISKSGKTRASVMEGLRQKLYEIDLQQEHIGKEIPPGPQRIRGIAGSGKTMLLCQKAAHMHLKHPQWDIGLVFFTRSLYDLMIELVDKWIRRFSNGDLQYNPQTNSKLRVLHAWGAKTQPGFYSTVCQYHGKRPLAVADTKETQPKRGLAQLCLRLQEEINIEPMFDAVLIDEGQDLVADDDLKYQDKQAFYWLAYQSLRPVNEEQPQQKRLIWAYDEGQSLESLAIPTAKEIFGADLSNLLNQQPQYPGGIKRSEVMRQCYRTPGAILTAAHAIGMGLLRPEGMICGITSKKDWDRIGYEVKGDFRSTGKPITVVRSPHFSPNPIPELWDEPVLDFQTYTSRQAELTALTENIMHNIDYDQLNPSRDILVIVLGSSTEAIELETEVATFLMDYGINIYIPTALNLNQLSPEYPDNYPNKFWHDGGVTVSRINRAKGHEADMVYLVGFDHVARNEDNVKARNQLFIGLTRARGWANLSGVGNYPLYDEMRRVIESGNTFTFTYNRSPKRNIDEEEVD